MSSRHAQLFPFRAQNSGNYFRSTPARSALTWVIVSQHRRHRRLLHPPLAGPQSPTNPYCHVRKTGGGRPALELRRHTAV